MAPEDSSKKVACIRCEYYQVTWDAQRPYGCRAHNFKTRKNPAAVVFESSGMECQLFREKKKPAQ
jgi:hypothetical protein